MPDTNIMEYHIEQTSLGHMVVKHDGHWAPGIPISYTSAESYSTKYRYATRAEIFMWDKMMELWNRLRELDPESPLIVEIYPGDIIWGEMAVERGEKME